MKQLHGCDEMPMPIDEILNAAQDPSYKDDEYVLKKFTKHFTFVRVLGSGTYGIVFEVTSKNLPLAMKVVVYEDETVRNEIRVACMLHGISNETRVFGTMLGWALSSQIPDAWVHQNIILDNRWKMPYLFFVMDKYPYPLMAIKFTETVLRCMFFMILHGLAQAIKKNGHFRHRDLHTGNIMVATNDKAIPVILPINEEYSYNIVNLPFIPKIIDYGLARLDKYGFKAFDEPKEENETFRAYTADGKLRDFSAKNDLVRLKLIFQDAYENSGLDTKKLMTFIESNDYKAAVRVSGYNYGQLYSLLQHDYFSIDEIQKVEYSQSKSKKTKTEEVNCSICWNPRVTHVIQTNVNYKFCADPYCQAKYTTILKYLPIKRH